MIIDHDTETAEDEIAKKCAKTKCDPLPETQLLELQILYNTPLLNKIGSEDKVSKLINSLMTHVQAYYCHPSLGSKVKLQQSGVKYYKESDWHVTSETLERLSKIADTDLKDSKANLFVGLTHDDETHGDVGLANTKVVCSERSSSVSINKWDSDMTTFANTVAHEMGHNLGMMHDHDHDVAKGCDKQGIMSYGDNSNKWSTCSRDDFTTHYRTVMDRGEQWCLPPAPSACAGV